MKNQIPVVTQKDSSLQVVGYASSTAHKKAMSLAKCESIKQELRTIDGRLRLCWIPIYKKL